MKLILCEESLKSAWGLMDANSGELSNPLAYIMRLIAWPVFKSTEKHANVAPGGYMRGCIPVNLRIKIR